MSNHHNAEQPEYNVKWLENFINNSIRFLFKYRLALVFLALIALGIIEYIIWNTPSPNRARNFAFILTGGSIVIGIFYSILNYEHIQLKFKHDRQSSKDVLTFNTAFRAHDPVIINHFRQLRNFYENNKDSINKLDKIHKKIEANADVKTSFICIFNYFECVALGVNQGLMDELFVKEFFKTLFRDYSNYFGSYIEYVRKQANSDRIFKNFTTLAVKWNAEN